jgi:hypothetical protein
LELTPGGLCAESDLYPLQPILFRQGYMDGACAVYSLMINLQIQGYVFGNDISPEAKFDKRKPKDKFLAHFLNESGLIRDGKEFQQFKKEIEKWNPDLTVTYFDSKSLNEKINNICDNLDKDLPVIISIEYKGDGAHALVAVGYEEDPETKKVLKILCVDPLAEEPKVSEWNCFIDTVNRRGTYCCKWVPNNQSAEDVHLAGFLLVDVDNYR